LVKNKQSRFKRSRFLCSIALACLLTFGLRGFAAAAPPDIVEEDIPPPASAPKQAKPKKEIRPAPAPRDEPAEKEHASPPPPPPRKPEVAEETSPLPAVSSKPEPAERTPDYTEKPERHDTPEPAARVEKHEAPIVTSSDSGDLTYTIRQGDTPSSIAELFNIDVSELLHNNHLTTDSVLHRDTTLRIPNPYAAQVKSLKSEIQKLNDELEKTRSNAETAASNERVMHGQVDELTSSNESLKHGVRVLPWWRAFAITAAVAVVVILGLFSMAMFDWYLLRRRFRTVVEMNESLRRLDHKYKSVLAKAELRFQQLYGRRRQGAQDGSDLAKSSEEIEIERLNQELRETLEEQLQRLGSNRYNGRHRLRDLFSFGGSLAERTERR
jgi:LysM repeat protein